ncbi:hypothetical protein KI387_013282 [Taxus chinensis]|uniref:LisH domain-containing protein n=1 Tax=Taxus chinensis TaxID=29808 RepID=A0AA38CR97_TAXCH|nr:hypothetical protein KI387_013282 [Taxus chinensis]
MARKKVGVGSGKVTAVQVAFIVERYLAENGFNNTLAHFRSEAASLLGTAHPRQAPKSMLSLVDILDDYISLKEQRIALGQEKARIDQLFFGMQDIMYAYHSGGMLPPTATAISGPGLYASASTATNGAVATPALPLPVPVPNNKRKNPKPLPNASLTAKKSCLAAHPFDPLSGETNAQGLQMAANGIYRPSQVGQPSSHTSTYPQICYGNGQPSWGPSNSVEKLTVQSDSASIVKSSYNQPSPAFSQGKQQPLHTYSQMTSDSTCPQTPPQALSNQPDSSAFRPEVSCAINRNTILVGSTSNLGSFSGEREIVYDEQGGDQEIQNFGIRSSENLNSSITSGSPNALPMGENPGKAPPPSTLNPRKPRKREHIKSRLDFNSSVATSTVSAIRSSAKGTSTDGISTCHSSATSVEIGEGQFDFTDIPIIDPELDKFMSEFFIDFGLDSEELGSTTALLDQPDRMRELVPLIACNEQTGFIKNRHILDIVIVVWEGMEWARISNQKALFIKIDFEKAYD